MELKKPKQNSLVQKAGKKVKSGSSVLWSLLLYNIFLLVVGITLFYKVVPVELQQKIINRLPSIQNKARSLTVVPERMDIDIKHKNFQKLAYVRKRSLEKGYLQDLEENQVPGSITYKGKTYRAQFSLKGRLPDHWDTDNMWSLKVKIKGDNSIMGMKEFALQHPKTRNYLNEWIVQKLYKYTGLNYMRYHFVSVDVNGKGSNIYALEEKFEKRLVENNGLKEGPIFKFNRDFYWDGGDGGFSDKQLTAQSFWGSDIMPFKRGKLLKDSLALRQFNKAKSLVEAFRQDNLKASEVFDVGKMAMLFAIIDLMGHHHTTNLDNIRFYYNPITSLIEPIGYDNSGIIPLEEEGLLGASKEIGDNIKHTKPIRWKNNAWYESLFKDKIFYASYIQALSKIARSSFLDNFFEEIKSDYDYNLGILQQVRSWYDFDEKDILYSNQKYIQRALYPQKLFHAYLAEKSDTSIALHIVNIQNFPIEVSAVYIGDSIELEKQSASNIIQAREKLSPLKEQLIVYRLPKDIASSGDVATTLKVKANILGANKSYLEAVHPWKIIDKEILSDDLMRQRANIYSFDFISVDEPNKIISFKKGVHQIDRNMILPKGYKVFIAEGTHIDLRNKASILTYSPVYFKGTEENPILFSSSDSTAQGLIIMEAGVDTSLLSYTYFDNLSNPADAAWSLSGALTFYRSPAIIEYCSFSNNRGGDDCLNIVQSDFSISHSSFFNTKADAFDGDFTDGKITDTRFINVGNDGIDVSGSNITIENLIIKNTADKAISAGENSRITGKNIEIRNAELAIVSKDYSKVFLNNIDILDCKIAYTAFQKKPEFGPATIQIASNATIQGENEIQYLIEEGSKLTLNNKSVKTDISIKSVKEILYGVKYGKSSK